MKLNPYLAIIMAATIGGFHGVLIKLIDMPASSYTFFRMGVPAIALLFFIDWKNLFRKNFKLMLVGSTVNAIRMFLYILAFSFTSVGNAVIMLFTWPFFASLLSIIFLKEKISLRTFLLLLLSFVGIIVMLGQDFSLGSRDFIGMGIMLISSIGFASTIIIFKKGLKEYSKRETIFYQNIFGILFIPFLFVNPIPSLYQISLAIIFPLMVGVGAFLLFFYALKELKVSHYSLFTYWEVPAAVIFAILFFKEIITANMVMGGIMIIISGLLLQRKQEIPIE